MNRLTAILATSLLCGSAWATEYHVLQDTDGDGLANPCPNASHQTYYNDDTISCAGGTQDIDGDGAAETIYCNLQTAFNAATGSGDTVDIHEGTWDENDSTVLDAHNLCIKDAAAQAMATIRGCTGCTAETDRRIVRASTMLGTAYDSVIFDYESTSIETSLVIGYAPDSDTDPDPSNYLTIEGISFNEAKWNSCDNSYMGVVAIAASVDYLIFKYNTIAPARYDTDAECLADIGATSEAGITSIAPIGFTSQRNDTNVEIAYNTFATCTGWSWKGEGSSGGGGLSSEYYQNLWFHHNSVTQTMQGRSGTGATSTSANLGELKGIENLIINNNLFIGPGPSVGYTGKFRYNRGSLYMFNNYFENVTNYFNQGSTFSTALYLFNNTIHQTGVGMKGWHQTDDGGVTVVSSNNSFSGLTACCAYDGVGTSPAHSVTNEHFDSKAHYIEKSASADSGSHICDDNAACGSNAAYTECENSASTCDATVSRSGDPPWRLVEGSELIGAGTNDPIGQGAGVCSISIGDWTIDCTLDYDGESRGSTWDIGADQFADASADPPDTPTNFDADGTVSKAPQLHRSVSWTWPALATTCDLRIDTSAINAGNFDSALTIDADRTDDRGTVANSCGKSCESGDTATVEVIGLQPGVTYHFGVRCTNANGDSGVAADSSTTASYEGGGVNATGGGLPSAASPNNMCWVTTTADSGTGSLRECESGTTRPAYIAFDPATNWGASVDSPNKITLLTDIRLNTGATEDDVTFDGSTADTPGVHIYRTDATVGCSDGEKTCNCPGGNSNCNWLGEFILDGTDNVIVTYLRFEGNYSGMEGIRDDPPTTEGDTTREASCLVIQDSDPDTSANIVLDHLTFHRCYDNAGGIYGIADDITLSFSYWLMNFHPLGISAGGTDERNNITIHHNLFAYTGERAPQLRRDTGSVTEPAQVVSNVHFGWSQNTSDRYCFKASGRSENFCTTDTDCPTDETCTAIQGDHAMRVRGQEGEGVPAVNIIGNYFIDTDPPTKQNKAIIYGSAAGDDSEELLGSGCVDQDSGTVETPTGMGEIWITGNVMSSVNCDDYNTVAAEITPPAGMEITASADQAAIITEVINAAGTHYRTTEEAAVAAAVVVGLGAEPPAVAADGTVSGGKVEGGQVR